MSQFRVTECGELQDPATRNLFSACGQADLPADTFGQLPLFSPFPMAGAWRRGRARPHSRSQIQVSKYYLSARKCNCIRGYCGRPVHWGKAVTFLPFHVWVGEGVALAQSKPRSIIQVSRCLCLSCRCGSEVHL